MKKVYSTPKTDFVMFGNDNIIRASCEFDCPSNCSCHHCVGVCTWDCSSDDSTCSEDWN